MLGGFGSDSVTSEKLLISCRQCSLVGHCRFFVIYFLALTCRDNFQIVSNLFYRENQGFQAAKFVGMKENT